MCCLLHRLQPDVGHKAEAGKKQAYDDRDKGYFQQAVPAVFSFHGFSPEVKVRLPF